MGRGEASQSKGLAVCMTALFLTCLLPLVSATGGGAVLDADSRSRLGARGFVVYLHTTVQQQLDRTQRGRSRPLLENGDKGQILEELMTVRDPLYREIADLTVETDGRRVQAVAHDIVDALG